MSSIIGALYLILMTYLITQYNYYLGMAYLTYTAYGLYVGYVKQAMVSKLYGEYMGDGKNDKG